MLDRNKAGNLEINAGRHFANPNEDFTISMLKIGMILAIPITIATGIELEYHPIERAYNFLVNHINYFN